MSTPSISADGTAASADVSITSLCSSSEYCGFYAEVNTVPDSQPCAHVITGSTWVVPAANYVYGATSATVSATASWTEYPTLQSGGKRACLYALSDGVLVAQATYTVPARAPTPVYVPPATATPTYPSVPVSSPASTYVQPQSLGRDEAIGVARSFMSRRYGRKWRKGYSRTVKCPVRVSSAQLGCYAVWIYKGHVYSRTMFVTEGQTSYTISRNPTSAPASVPTSSPSGDFCSTHVCIPNYPNGTGTTVRCADGTYSHSGGKQGACSYHGGVGRAAARTSAKLSRERNLATAVRASRLARVAAHRVR